MTQSGTAERPGGAAGAAGAARAAAPLITALQRTSATEGLHDGRMLRRYEPDTIGAAVWAWPGYMTLALGLAAALVAPGEVHRIRYVPLLVSLLVLGLPHGAVDHLVPGWIRGRRLGRRELWLLIGAYLAVTAAGVTVWLLAPVAALVVFFTVAAAHWGASELIWFPTAHRPVAFAAARGLVPIALPALVFPTAFSQATTTLLSPFLAHPPVIAPSSLIRVAGFAVLALICLAGTGQGTRERLELAGLAAFFALVDPVFAIGLYFIAWHSWRHIVRLATLEPAAAAALEDGRPARAVAFVLQAALPCTAVALAGLGGFAAVLAIDASSAQQVTAVALALIGALTVPHAVVVAWLDGATAHRRPGVLKRAQPRGAHRARK
jgi:Brp/Blh family beta-carotene 15,15'-monooxygenase